MPLPPEAEEDPRLQPDERTLLPPPVQQALLAIARRKLLDRGDALFLKGSMPDALFGVVNGELRVSAVGPDGREALIARLEAGHWFGEVSLLIGRERVYAVAAVKPTEVAVVDAADFHALVAARPDVLMALTRLICFRLRQALAWIDDAMLMPLSARLARRLCSLHAGPADASQAVRLNVSQEDLAAMLGVSRQSVNRVLKQWESEALLRIGYRSVDVLRWDLLLAHAQIGA
jgi:CRP/FNR family cyclic AMP-dependent transcriptional regulator